MSGAGFQFSSSTERLAHLVAKVAVDHLKLLRDLRHDRIHAHSSCRSWGVLATPVLRVHSTVPDRHMGPDRPYRPAGLSSSTGGQLRPQLDAGALVVRYRELEIQSQKNEAPYPYHKTTLPNGVRVVTGPMTGVKSGTLIFSYSVGSRYEPAPISGVSHFLEHMLFKGTERRPDPKLISEEIEGVGGVLNAATRAKAPTTGSRCRHRTSRPGTTSWPISCATR